MFPSFLIWLLALGVVIGDIVQRTELIGFFVYLPLPLLFFIFYPVCFLLRFRLFFCMNTAPLWLVSGLFTCLLAGSVRPLLCSVFSFNFEVICLEVCVPFVYCLFFVGCLFICFMNSHSENVRLCFDFVLLAWSLVAYIDDLASFSFFKIVLLLLLLN